MNKWLKIAIGFCLFVVVVVVAAPKLLSTPTVKTRVAAQLSDVLGLPVQLNGSSSVSLRPYLGVSWSDVVVGSDSDAMPLLTMDRLDAKLTLSAALFGDARLSELTLVRPVLRLIRNGQGVGNWQAADGQLGRWFASQNEAKVALGRLMIVDGIALQDDATTRTSRKLTGLQGEIVWPSTSSAASANLGAIWNGEPFRVTAQIDDPAAMRDGQKSDVAFTLSANPVQLSFDGEIARPGVDADARFTGDLAMETTSTTRLREWAGLPHTAFDVIGPARVSGKLDMNGARASIADASVDINGQAGTGQLNFQWNRESAARLSGTLGFEQLELPNPVTSERPLADLFGQPQGSAHIDLDLRLSAISATVGSAPIAEVAAAILVQDGRTTIDIAQAETQVGQLTGSMRLVPADIVTDSQATITANLALSGTNFSQISPDATYGLNGNGNTSFQLEASGPDMQSMIASLGGDVVLELGAGELRGLDAAALLSADQGNNIPTGGTTSFDKGRLALFIVSGTAYVREGQFSGADADVDFGGRIDIAEGTLALRGEARSNTSPELEPATIFVGGTSAAPLLVPLPNRIALPATTEEPAAKNQQNIESQ